MKLGLVIALGLTGGCSLYRGDEGTGWIGEDLPSCETTRSAYRVDRLDLPTTSEAADELGWDHDGDGRVDNWGGNLMVTVGNWLEIDLQGAVDELIDGDAVHIGMTVDECASPSYALISVVRGVALERDASTPALLGESVTTFPSVALDGVPGAAIDGTAKFPVAQLIHPASDEWSDTIQLAVQVDAIDDGGITGRLSSLLGYDAIDNELMLAFYARILDRIEELGPCTPDVCDKVLRKLFDVFDENEDGDIILYEVQSNSLVQTLVRADVDTDDDGEADHFSVGVGFHASPVDLFVRDDGP